MTDLHALITEMATELDYCQQLLMDDRRQRHPLADRARALLAEPEAEGPTDEELLESAAKALGYKSIPSDETCLTAEAGEILAYGHANIHDPRNITPWQPDKKNNSLMSTEDPLFDC